MPLLMFPENTNKTEKKKKKPANSLDDVLFEGLEEFQKECQKISISYKSQ